MTENNAQSAECLSHLTAELDTGIAMICEKRGFVGGDVIQGAEDGHIAIIKPIFSFTPKFRNAELLGVTHPRN